MPYEDVPQRLVDGDAVPASEIIGYIGSDKDMIVRLTMQVLVMMLCMEKVFEDETVKYRITAFGMQMREDFITRLEGECPECP